MSCGCQYCERYDTWLLHGFVIKCFERSLSKTMWPCLALACFQVWLGLTDWLIFYIIIDEYFILIDEYFKLFIIIIISVNYINSCKVCFSPNLVTVLNLWWWWFTVALCTAYLTWSISHVQQYQMIQVYVLLDVAMEMQYRRQQQVVVVILSGYNKQHYIPLTLPGILCLIYMI